VLINILPVYPVYWYLTKNERSIDSRVGSLYTAEKYKSEINQAHKCLSEKIPGPYFFIVSN